MYVLVHHTIHDPAKFWGQAQSDMPIPAALMLHQTLSARDGTLATCLWEGPSIEAVRDFLDPYHAGIATNQYREAENREGFVIPAMYRLSSAPAP